MEIFTVFHDALNPDREEDVDAHYIQNDANLERMGGVIARDRVKTRIVKDDGTYSSCSFDPRAVDLEMFAYLDTRAN
jgi:hypothetical protein